MLPNGVVRKDGASPGKTVAIFGGVHGNERVGVRTIEHLLKTLTVQRGSVYLVYANPEAIEKQVRLVHANLNRLFDRSLTGDTYEYARATELMDILDTCDALLDIHSYNSPSGDQFLITEENALDIAAKLDFPVVGTGFTRMGAGSDSYMTAHGKVGITAECGTSNRTDDFFPLAVTTAMQFLQHFGVVDEVVPYAHVPQKRVHAERLVLKQTDSFRFTRDYKDFEPLADSEVYATDGTELRAGTGECIIFPRESVPVGGEACIIGRFY
jgi:succinylglutamate desuccinylase